MNPRSQQRGISLVEVVIALVMIAAAAGTIMGALGRAADGSARDIIATQSVLVAGSYLELVAGRPFDDPDGIGGEARAGFDDISDYNGLRDVGARDALGAALPGLGLFNVSVTVRPTTALPGVPAAQARRIDVTVRDATGRTTVATAYRVRS